MLGVGGPTEESELLALIGQTGKQTWEEVRKTKWVKRMERGQGLRVRVCVRAPALKERPAWEGQADPQASTLSCCVGLSVAYLHKLQEAHVAGCEGERQGVGLYLEAWWELQFL